MTIDWSFLRDVLVRGAAIHQDHLAGTHASYEAYSARLDAAARELTVQVTATPQARELVPAKGCTHPGFDAIVTVNRLGDAGRFQADVRVQCGACGTPFRFIGLPAGVDLNGAAVSVDGTEGRFAIAPKGEVVTPLDGVGGFTVRRTAGDGATQAAYPAELTEPLRDALGTMCFQCGPIAALFRKGGQAIEERAEDEQAAVLHWMIGLVLRHGDGWRAKATEEVQAIHQRIKGAAG